MLGKISKAKTFVNNNPLTYEGLISLEDPETILLAAVMGGFNQFELLDRYISILDDQPLREKIERYNNTPLDNLIIPENIETVVLALSMGGEYTELAKSILSLYHLPSELADPHGLILTLRKYNALPRGFEGFVEDIDVSSLATQEDTLIDETEQKVKRGEITLNDSKHQIFFHTLELGRFSEINDHQRIVIKEIMNDKEDKRNGYSSSASALSKLNTLSRLFLTGGLGKGEITFSIDIPKLKNSLGLYKIENAPWLETIKESTQEHISKASTNLVLETAVEMGLSNFPVLGPIISKGLFAGKEIWEDVAQDRVKSFSYDREEKIFKDFLKSSETSIREFLNKLFYEELKTFMLKQFNYEFELEEVGFIRSLSTKITNQFISTALSRTSAIKSDKIKNIIKTAPDEAQETIAFLAVNQYIFDEFSDEDEVMNILSKKSGGLDIRA